MESNLFAQGLKISKMRGQLKLTDIRPAAEAYRLKKILEAQAQETDIRVVRVRVVKED